MDAPLPADKASQPADRACPDGRATIRNSADGSRFEQAAGDTILRAALRSGLGSSYECNSGGCGSCKFELLSGEVRNLWPQAPGLSERDRRRGRQLACQCVAVGEIEIKLPTAAACFPHIRPIRQRAQLAGKRTITHDIVEFRFVVEQSAEFLPGQFAMLDVPGVGAPRAYSMSNIANDQREWQFCIRRVPGGSATELLFERLRIGDEVGLDGPYGIAWLREDSPRDIVCVAGGSGLAPMISIARGAARAGMLASRRLHFFYGGRSPRDICGEALLATIPGAGQQIDYCPVVSGSADPDGEPWTGEVGLVHEVVARRLGAALRACECYFAGPPPMAGALQEMLMLGQRVPFEQIHFDRFF